MATIDIGKIRFTWRSTWVNTIAYSQNDAVSYNGSSWIAKIDQTASAYNAVTVYSSGDLASDGGVVYRFINATPTAGQQPSASVGYWSTNEPTSSNTVYWDIVAEGTNILTTQGDLMTHDGTNATRLPIGNSGEVLTVSGSDVTYSPVDAVQGRKVLMPNYDNLPNHNATNTYGASGSLNWLADYTNNWVPECGIPNTALGPNMWADGHDRRGYRSFVYLNQNHEVVISGGTDGYYWQGQNNSNTHEDGIVMGIHPEFGGLVLGEYFVKIWHTYQNIYCLTNKGSVFSGGYNGYGQLGVGDSTDRYHLVKIPAFGPNATHSGNSAKVIGFHVGTGGDGYGNYHHCFAIIEDGTLFSWGHNGNGALGIGNTTNQTRPQEVTAVGNCIMVQSSYLTTFAVDSSRNLYVCGYNANGVLAGQTSATNQTTFAQSSGATNVYHFVQTTQTYYSGGWTYVGTSHYLNTSGELYGSGYAGNGQLGDGTTTEKNAWTRIGGSATYSSFYYSGNSAYNCVYALGGTPFNSNDEVHAWGYNGNAQIGNGNTTNQTSPQRPSTTMLYSYTTTSTAADSAPTQTLLTFPRDDISEIFPMGGMMGQATGHAYFVGKLNGKFYQVGYSQSHEWWRNNSGNSTINNIRTVIGPFTTPETTITKHWAGETQRTLVAIVNSGYIYNSEGLYQAFFSDGTAMLIGYNGTGTIDSNQGFYGHWKQVN